MKTTTFSITLCLALLAPIATVQAGLPTQSLFVLFGAVAPGQQASSQQEADNLLASARKAMNEGQIELADSFINRAEKLNPQYNALHFGDTPQKLRAELAKKQTVAPTMQAAPATLPAMPNMLAASPTTPQLLPSSNSPLLPSANSLPYGSNNTVQAGYTNPNDSSRLRQPSISPPGGFGVKYDNMVVPAAASESIPPAQSTLSIAGVSSTAPTLPTPTLPATQPLPTPTLPATTSSLYSSPANIGQPAAAPRALPPAVNSSQPTTVAQNPSSFYPVAQNQAGQAAPLQSPYAANGGVAPAQVITPANNNPFGQANTLPAPNRANEYLQKGEAALQAGQIDQAAQMFNLARDNQSDLDQAGRDRLQNHLQLLSRNQSGRTPPAGLLDSASTTQTLIAKQVSSEVSKIQTQAKEIRATNPRKALEMLEQAKTTYTSAAGIDPAIREQIQRRLDLSIGEVKKYMSENASQIALDESNKAVRDEVQGAQQKRIDTDAKITAMIKEFNELNKEHRYEESLVIAKKLRELAPENPIVEQVMHNAKMLRNLDINKQIAEDKADGFNYSLLEVDRAAIPTAGEYVHGYSAKDWANLKKTRGERVNESTSRRSPREREIEQRLSTPVQVKFVNRPLREVLELLSKVTDVPIVLDPQGLAAESISAEQPVMLNLERDISLRSALRNILPQFKLNYVIKNDVLLVTSEMLTRGEIYAKTYAVADLVIPIPNFAPTGQEGLVGALNEGYRQANMWRAAGAAGWRAGGTGLAALQVAATGANVNADQNPDYMAQQNRLNGLGNTGFNGYNGGSNAGPQMGQQNPISFGPNGMGGGGAQPDFESLINLIQTTVQPKTWKEVSGDDNGGTIDRYQTNLSLVVRNTQEVHEELADLLQQLRRLQDLQVTIEVRFVTLSDNFFERIGIDFDFTIDDNVTSAGFNSDIGPSAVIGLTPGGTPAPNLSLPFAQGSFTSGTVPTFPGLGFDPATAGTFGFAILSDIEAFFLINAAQGDSRSNILQAPKVTLFNGQTAFVSDFTQRPFVASVIPVVGDFAIGQQPVIVVLGEGTTLTVQAVVSNDRRFVRLTVVPFFSQIDDVEEFTFVGSKTSTTKDSDTKDGDDAKSTDKEKSTTEEGVTIQRPTFSVVSVNTTVSVPDGGTVLLGGIKRLSEGRNERGIPILSKLPYINRLFKNVGIGRTTQSLMIMVTPRIIIQEEEEAKLTGTDPAAVDTTTP